MRASILIKQHDITDCGAACLASIARHYGLGMPIARIRQYAGTDRKGTNILGLVEAAQKLGFQAKGVKGTIESISKIPLPSIAHVVMKGGLHHYVVLYEVTGQSVKYMDPGDGEIHINTLEEFKKIWTGVLVILLPAENFVNENQRISVMRRFWALVNPHKSVMVQALFGAAVATLLGLSTSIYIQKITDHVLPSSNMNLLRLLSVGMLLILVLQTVVGTIKTVFVFKTGQQIDAQLILGYYKHLLTLPQQFFSFQSKMQENLFHQQKIKKELDADRKLFTEKVIAMREFDSKEFEHTQLVAQYESVFRQQMGQWQSDLSTQRADLQQLHAEEKQLAEQKKNYAVSAPVAGTMQQISGKYVGSFIQAGESLGIISPDDSLIIAECYVSPQDIGLIKKGQHVLFRMDAFNYNEWGMVKGSVVDIARDFTIMQDKPVFKVKCSLNQKRLKLKNGYQVLLTKGLSLRAKFVIAKRSLYQLLYDKADDWLNPLDG